MAPAWYLSDVIYRDDAGEDGFYPAVSVHIEHWRGKDGRADPTQVGQAMLVSCEPTDDEHNAMVDDARVDYIGTD